MVACWGGARCLCRVGSSAHTWPCAQLGPTTTRPTPANLLFRPALQSQQKAQEKRKAGQPGAGGGASGGSLGGDAEQQAGLAADGGDGRKRSKKAAGEKQPKEYIPRIGTANFAFLLVLLEVRATPQGVVRRVHVLAGAWRNAACMPCILACDKPIRATGGSLGSIVPSAAALRACRRRRALNCVSSLPSRS